METMDDIIEKAKDAYTEREGAKQKIDALRLEAEEEAKQFKEQQEALEEEIQKQTQTRDFIKAQEESKGDSSSKSKGKGEAEQNKLDNLNELFNTEKLLRKKTCDKAFEIAKEISQGHSQVNEYEEALDQIKEATKLNDSNELMDEFQKAGEQNNWLENYVVEVKSEVDTLEDEIKSIQEEIA